MPITERRRHALCASLLAFCYAGSGHAVEVAVCTDVGSFTIELLDQQSPLHSANFLEYVDRGFYMGTVFHRVIGGFVVQGGGYTREFRNKLTLPPVENESQNGVGNSRGTIAAARTGDPHSATSQFYINLEDNDTLNASGGDWGYTVFGQVTQGMAVVDEIAALPTGPRGPFTSDVTDPLVAVTSMARVVEDRYPGRTSEERHNALRSDIEAAARASDNAALLQHFGEYRAACGEFTPEMLFQEANALAEGGNNAAATESLAEFLRVADNTSETYLEALQLSRRLDPAGAADVNREQVRFDELTANCAIEAALPAMPDGATAVMDEMLAAQESINVFMESSNEYLECLEEVIDDLDDDEQQEDRDLVVSVFNSVVQSQEQLRDAWSETLGTFRETQ